MKNRLFFLSRVANDFERFVAIVDRVGEDYQSTIFSCNPLFRLVNRDISQLLECSYTLIDLSKISILEKIHHFSIFGARKLKSAFLHSVAIKFKIKAEKKSKIYAKKILDKYNPTVLFTCISDCDISLPIYQAIMKEAEQRKITKLIVNTGIAVFASEFSGIDRVVENSSFACDYFCASGADEVHSYYFPKKKLNGPYKACLAMGDPKNSKVFLRKILQFSSKKANELAIINKEKSIAIFGNNLPNFGDVVKQDLALLRIVKWLFALNRDLVPLVKFHPNTSHNKVKQEIIDLGVQIIPNYINSIDLLDSVDYFISPPTTVMFEAFILDKKVLIVDDLEDRPFDSKRLGFPSIRSEYLSTIDFDSITEIQDKSKVSQFIWGPVEQEDCRDNYILLLDTLAKKEIVEKSLETLIVE